MNVQVAVETLPENVVLPPRRSPQPEKSKKAVKFVGLSKPKKADEQKNAGSTKSAGIMKPEKSNAKGGSSTRAEVAKKKSVGMSTAIGESSQGNPS